MSPFRSIRLLIAAPLCLLLAGEAARAETVCGYYAGFGYHCFGDQGDKSGKALKQVESNTRKCGYFDPGCLADQRQKSGYAAPKAGPGYQPPKVGPGYQPPTVGPGYQPPRAQQ